MARNWYIYHQNTRLMTPVFHTIRLFAALMLIWASTVALAQAQAEPTKEEIEFWKKKAKEYQTKPLRLKQEFDNYRDQVLELKKRNKELLDLNMSLNNNKSQLEADLATCKAGAAPASGGSNAATVAELEALKAEVKTLTARKQQLEADLAACQASGKHRPNNPPAQPQVIAAVTPSPEGPSRSETELRNNLAVANKKMDSLMWENATLRGELTTMTQNYKKTQQAYASIKSQVQQGITKTGLVYRLQIGAFVLHEVQTDAIVDNEEFGAERADGFNKYVIASCRTYEEAQKFRDELRKIGVKDAWIVPYLDGVRVTMQEAADYLRQQGTPATPATQPKSGTTPAPQKPGTSSSPR